MLVYIHPLSPQTCESAFATKDRLRAHMIRHEEKVPCHVCGKLLSAAYITDHMRVHSQSQNHVCETCNRGPGGACPHSANQSSVGGAQHTAVPMGTQQAPPPATTSSLAQAW
ncbi:UNVERIFIED_CONTAM: hypothetical protein FKN15_067259 [Acipenser sinensis]